MVASEGPRDGRMAAMDFEPLRADFLRITTDIIYCTVTTVTRRADRGRG